MLIRQAARRDHEVLVGAVDGLRLEADVLHLFAQPVAGDSLETLESCLGALKTAPLTDLALGPDDTVWIRTNPARDPARAWAHAASLDMLRYLQSRGGLVINDPAGLQRASSKLYLQFFPAWLRPETLISADPKRLAAFVADRPESVLKPLTGTWGRDVFRAAPGARNLKQIIDLLCRSGHAIAQEFLPAAVDGDIRLVLLEGRILERDGKVLAVRRRPGRGDFRSNIHAGGKAEPAEIGPVERKIAEAVGPKLMEDGIMLAGLDIIGGKLIEINVYATGGFRHGEQFTGIGFSGEVVAAVERMRG